MPYEREIEQLAKGAIGTHGQLQEVVFLEANKDSLLVFADGTVIPVLHQQHGYDIRNEPYAAQLAREHSGTDYFSLLAFGYSGTGPTCYAAFLRTAGFQSANVEDVATPLKLKPDGTMVHGAERGGAIEWEDGSATPVPGKASKRPQAVPPPPQRRETPAAEAGTAHVNRTLIDRNFPAWDYHAVQELERLCAELPILSREQATAFFNEAGRATKGKPKVVERSSGKIFESMTGVVRTSDRKDFSVTCHVDADALTNGIFMLETYDKHIGVLFCVARVSDGSFLTHAFLEGQKQTVKELRAGRPKREKKWWAFWQ